MKIRVLFFSALFIFMATSLFADTIILKSGKKIEGKILERAADSVKIDIVGVGVPYYLTDIEEINGEKVILPSVTKATLEQKTVLTVETTPGNGVKNINYNVEKTAVMPTQENSSLETAQLAALLKKIPFQIMINIALGIIIVFILLYVYSSLCLHFIARKTSCPNVWMAWVPIANLFLMCKIGGVSYLWLLLLLIGFVPIIGLMGVFSSIGLAGFMWWKISAARNKPAWLGILCVIPVINLFIIGYLAFSN